VITLSSLCLGHVIGFDTGTVTERTLMTERRMPWSDDQMHPLSPFSCRCLVYIHLYFFVADKRGDLAIFGDISLHGITSRATSLRIHSTKNYPIRSIFGLGAPIHVWGRPALRASPLPPPTASPHYQRNPRSPLGHSGGPHCQPHCQLSQ
jgi:hypothetical protein